MLTIKKYLREALIAVTALGTAYFYGLLIIFLFLLKKYDVAIHLIIGLLLCYIFVFIIRLFYFKERPVKEDYFNFFTRINASSFPSLHTLSSIYAATVLAVNFKTIEISIFFYAVALLIAYSRIYVKKHYLTDVLVGLALGLIASLIYIYLI